MRWIPSLGLAWAAASLLAGTAAAQSTEPAPGVYVYEGGAGTLEIRPDGRFKIDTVGANFHTCNLEGRIAQALLEEVVYDRDGTPRTTNLAEYLVPSAAELCSIEAHTIGLPSPVNPIGAKGIGQAGAIGATPAVQNAVIDALGPFGVRHIDLPVTPERVWRAILDARD